MSLVGAVTIMTTNLVN